MKARSVCHVMAPSAAWVLLMALLLLLLSSSTCSSSFRADGDDQGEDYPPLADDEGSGPDDEDLSYLFSGVTDSDVTFRCYRCTGVTEQSGCNVTLLRESPADYVIDCNGHCLNISTEDSTVFDCTDNVPLRSARCFRNEGILMCVCGTDLCNGPPLSRDPEDVMPLPSSHHHLNLTSLRDGNGTLTDFRPTLPPSGTSDHNVTMTSHPLNVNVTSQQRLDMTSSGVDTTPQPLNSTSPHAVPVPDSKLSQINVTSPQINMTSRQKNLSSEEVGVLTSRRADDRGPGGGGGNVILPETFKQRQQNGTVIEAASKSGGDRARLRQPSTLCVVMVAVVVVMTLVMWCPWIGQGPQLCS